MFDLFGNSQDQFSHVMAHMVESLVAQWWVKCLASDQAV